MNPSMEELRLQIAEHVIEISELFKPGVKVSVIVRVPWLENGSVVVTDDSLEEISTALAKLGGGK